VSAIGQFAATELGLTLTSGQAEMVTAFEEGHYSEAVWQAGRRGGKSLLADVIALYDIAARDHLRQYLRPGELRIAGIVCPRIDQAADHLANCRNLLDHSPRLKQMLVSATSEELLFSNAAAIRAYPCSARAARGGAWSSAILDELAHFIDADGSNAAAERVHAAVKPALAQFGEGEGWLISISTPRWKQGQFFQLTELAKSGRFASMHYVHKATREMNPAISATFLEEEQRKDPDLFVREYLAEFADGIASYLSSEDVVGCVRRGVNILPPRSGVAYRTALDPGFSQDAFAMTIAHQDGARTVVDGCWTWHRKGYDVTLNEVRDLAQAYGIRELMTDQSSAEPIRAGLQRRGLSVDYKPWTNETKSNAFSGLKLGLNTRQIELPDNPGLVEELINLEARALPSGLTRIAAAGAGHDDRATSLAAVVDALRPKLSEGFFVVDMNGYGLSSGEEWRSAGENPLFSNQGWSELG
jgi:hypothetical protein